MSQTPFLFELSGEHPSLPSAEAISCCQAECPSFSILDKGPGYIIISFPTRCVEPIGHRIALTHRIGEYLASCTPSEAMVTASNLELPEGTFAVRVKRWGRSHPAIDCNHLASTIGGVLARGREVDLTNPDIEVRVLLSDRLHIYITRHVVDRSSFEERKVAERPFFSPISLHPGTPRSRQPDGRSERKIADPFCGRGILIEAASIGVRAVGSDISPDMVEGCKSNMRHFGLSGMR